MSIMTQSEPAISRSLWLASSVSVLLHLGAGYWLFNDDKPDTGVSIDQGIGGLTLGVGQKLNEADLLEIQQRLQKIVPAASPPLSVTQPVLKQDLTAVVTNPDIIFEKSDEKLVRKIEPKEKLTESVKPIDPVKIIQQQVIDKVTDEATEPQANRPFQPDQMAAQATTGISKDQTNGGQQGQTQVYLGELLHWLERHKRYPRKAKRTGIEGTAQLRFSMQRNGRVVQPQIQQSSGSAVLDKAALRLLQEASPLPPAPESLQAGRDTLTLVIPVVYKIQ